MKTKQIHDYLSIRIMELFTSFALLFPRFLFYRSFRIIKFVFTVFTIIFWNLSLSNRYMNTTAFWTNFNKIPRYLKVFIIGLFNKSFCLSSQNFNTDFDNISLSYKGISLGCYQYFIHSCLLNG